MDYKSVLEEQIRELQKIQDTNKKLPDTIRAHEMCKTAETILRIALEAQHM